MDFIYKGKKVFSEKIGDKIWIYANQQTYVIDAVQGKLKRKGESSGSNEILAPMPGRVTKILVSPNDQVTKGQSILVMEAMKMEYTLKAEIAGQIAVIECTEGSQVTLGKTLVRLKVV